MSKLGQDYQSWQAPVMERQEKQTVTEISKQDIEAIKKNARREGFNQGYREGKATGEKFMRQKADLFSGLLERLSLPLQELDEQVEEQLMELSLAIARQIIRREIQQDKGQIMAVVREAMQALPVAERLVRLVLHPDDAAFVQDVLPQEEGTRWQIVDDPGCARGDCRILAGSTEIDATVETRLATIAARLFGGQREGDSHE